MPARYDCREADGAWEVFDVTTGMVAFWRGVPQWGMGMDDADDLSDLLNALDADNAQSWN